MADAAQRALHVLMSGRLNPSDEGADRSASEVTQARVTPHDPTLHEARARELFLGGRREGGGGYHRRRNQEAEAQESPRSQAAHFF